LPDPEAGGHFWVYLNWALGLRALGCRVIWLEGIEPNLPRWRVKRILRSLNTRLEPYGLANCVALAPLDGQPFAFRPLSECVEFEAALDADLLLNMFYRFPSQVVSRFSRTALVDIDPGLLQIWLDRKILTVPEHDLYFTTGETVGQPGARFPDAGLEWHYTPPCVALNWWPPSPAVNDAPFTTVSHWYQEWDWVEYEGEVFCNDKRSGFQPFLDLPRHTSQPLELALCFGPEEPEERATLEARGWRIRNSSEVSSTPWDYQRYCQVSRGEFSCVKPSCVYFQNAWISDRTLCYLASGKPAIIQHTGPSRFLPDDAGLFRFRDMPGAVACLDKVAADYENQCRLARALAEEYFDAEKVVAKVLERALS